MRPRNVYANRGSKITVTGINDLADVTGTLTVDVVSAHGTNVFRAEKAASLVSGISSLFEDKLDANQLAGSYTVRARLAGDDGSLLAENTVAIDVFGERQLTVPTAKVAVLDTNNSLLPFLNAHDVAYVEFGAGTPKSLPVFVPKATATTAQAKARFQALKDFVEQGGTAVYLETVQRWAQNPFWGGKLPTEDVLPVRASIQHAMGLWVGVSHIVTDHPVFDGLPSKCMMGQAYENVWSPQTLLGTGGELIVGSVSHGWHQGEKDSQHYLGPSPPWYGVDMGIVPYGRGRYVLSALRLVESLGRDPVADKILFNLIELTTADSE